MKQNGLNQNDSKTSMNWREEVSQRWSQCLFQLTEECIWFAFALDCVDICMVQVKSNCPCEDKPSAVFQLTIVHMLSTQSVCVDQLLSKHMPLVWSIMFWAPGIIHDLSLGRHEHEHHLPISILLLPQIALASLKRSAQQQPQPQQLQHFLFTHPEGLRSCFISNQSLTT